MVLWEITLATAYFLGLRRTYRLALKIQRRLISPKYNNIRQLARRRTRAIFDVVIKVHRNIQERDIEAGRNLGNWILRWLDRMKPAAEIRPGNSTSRCNANKSTAKKLNSSHQKIAGGYGSSDVRSGERDSGRHLFTSSKTIWPKAYPTIAMMIRPAKPAGINFPNRHFLLPSPGAFELSNGRSRFDGVIRKDIMQWMKQN